MAERTVYLERDMDTPEVGSAFSGTYAAFSMRCPGKGTPNEDVAGVVQLSARSGFFAVCDGAGGTPEGGRAARITMEKLEDSVLRADAGGESLRAGILDGIESADAAIRALGSGAATTCAVVEIDSQLVRTYHVGDSMILVVGQRGRIKLKTVSHSPVGFAVESGMMDEDEAVHHDDRHLVSNLLGTSGMSIEVGSAIRLAPRDTLLVASDGLFDNLYFDEIVEIIRRGPLGRVARVLVARALERMQQDGSDGPSKPDDLTFVLFRRTGGRST